MRQALGHPNAIIKRLRRIGVNSYMLTRAAGAPMVTYGAEIHGMAKAHLAAARRSVAKAVAPDAGGKSYELVLATAGTCGTVDPAFDAHGLPIWMWTMAL